MQWGKDMEWSKVGSQGKWQKGKWGDEGKDIGRLCSFFSSKIKLSKIKYQFLFFV